MESFMTAGQVWAAFRAREITLAVALREVERLEDEAAKFSITAPIPAIRRGEMRW